MKWMKPQLALYEAAADVGHLLLTLIGTSSLKACCPWHWGRVGLSCKWWNNSSVLRKASLALESPPTPTDCESSGQPLTSAYMHLLQKVEKCLIEKCLWKYIWHLLNGGLIRLKAWKESHCYLCSMLMAVPFSDPVYVLQWWQVLFLK